MNQFLLSCWTLDWLVDILVSTRLISFTICSCSSRSRANSSCLSLALAWSVRGVVSHNLLVSLRDFAITQLSNWPTRVQGVVSCRVVRLASTYHDRFYSAIVVALGPRLTTRRGCSCRSRCRFRCCSPYLLSIVSVFGIFHLWLVVRNFQVVRSHVHLAIRISSHDCLTNSVDLGHRMRSSVGSSAVTQVDPFPVRAW